MFLGRFDCLYVGSRYTDHSMTGAFELEDICVRFIIIGVCFLMSRCVRHYMLMGLLGARESISTSLIPL